MTSPSSTDAKGVVAKPTPKMPHERDESSDGPPPAGRPEIQQAYDAVAQGHSDTSKGEATDKAYNDQVVGGEERKSGTAPGRAKPDPAAEK